MHGSKSSTSFPKILLLNPLPGCQENKTRKDIRTNPDKLSIVGDSPRLFFDGERCLLPDEVLGREKPTGEDGIAIDLKASVRNVINDLKKNIAKRPLNWLLYRMS